MKRVPAVLSLMPAAGLAACSWAPGAGVAALEPSRRTSPAEVVRILIAALEEDDADDRGIETVFRFASPEDRSVTGPLARLAALIRSPLFKPMLGHVPAAHDAMEVAGELARQQVAAATARGSAVVYAFLPRRRPSGPYGGFRMTERLTLVDVVRLPPGRAV